MKSLNSIQSSASQIKYLFCDIDDTITTHSKLPHQTLLALEQLNHTGIQVIPVTGRPAGWADHIARMWPVKAVIGENGAFYFYKNEQQKLIKVYGTLTPQQVIEQQKRLLTIADTVLKQHPKLQLASDQAYRQFDVALDFAEDVQNVSSTEVNEVMNQLAQYPDITAKLSSIHINFWIGKYTKLSMLKQYCREQLNWIWPDQNNLLQEYHSQIIYVGDSPNDEPMFEAIPLSVGVANVLDFNHVMKHMPHYICSKRAADGFFELVQILCDGRKKAP